jgi:hypothetical protein
MPTAVVVPLKEDVDKTTKKRKSKMKRVQSIRGRWWMSEEAKNQMKTDYDSIVKITDTKKRGSAGFLFWNSEHGVINPQSKFLVIWDLLMLTLILFISFSIPYETGFLDSVCRFGTHTHTHTHTHTQRRHATGCNKRILLFQ